MSDLCWRDASVDLGGRRVVDGATLSVRSGELVALVGANGAGKTTLLRAGLGLVGLSGGAVLLDGADPRTMASELRARKRAYLPQTRAVAWDLSVHDVVALGRFAYGASLAGLSEPDSGAVASALAVCRLEELADRKLAALSGGEQARVHMARTLATGAPLILADEPVAMLDPLHGFETMAILKRHCTDGGGALVSLHDLNLAMRFADRVVVMSAGRVLIDDRPQIALSPDVVRQAFGVEASPAGRGIVVDGPA